MVHPVVQTRKWVTINVFESLLFCEVGSVGGPLVYLLLGLRATVVVNNHRGRDEWNNREAVEQAYNGPVETRQIELSKDRTEQPDGSCVQREQTQR